MARRLPSTSPAGARFRPDRRHPGLIPRAELAAGVSPCDHCVAKCCRYFTVDIDEPTTWDDYDAVRWYLAHGQTLVYVEKGTWFLVVMTRCRYLGADRRCRIYPTRPKICREYTTEECEYDDDWEFEKVFESPEQLWEYAEAILPPRRPSRKPVPPASLSILPTLPVIFPPG